MTIQQYRNKKKDIQSRLSEISGLLTDDCKESEYEELVQEASNLTNQLSEIIDILVKYDNKGD